METVIVVLGGSFARYLRVLYGPPRLNVAAIVDASRDIPQKQMSRPDWKALGALIILTACAQAQTATPPTPTHIPASATAAFTPTATLLVALPSPTSTPTEQQALIEELAGYGVSVANADELTPAELRPIVMALAALGEKALELTQEADENSEADRTTAFSSIFGPTVIRVYPSHGTVDGIHYGINCGWEGQSANGCKQPDIYPEQDFPAGAWLILLAGDGLRDTSSKGGAGLVTHELAHNLTWGGGHNPANTGGYSYTHYVGEDFALEYADALGVQAGHDAYKDQDAREANLRWRAELTADAIASWALDDIGGPYAESIGRYIHDMMLCEITGGPLCY